MNRTWGQLIFVRVVMLWITFLILKFLLFVYSLILEIIIEYLHEWAKYSPCPYGDYILVGEINNKHIKWNQLVIKGMKKTMQSMKIKSDRVLLKKQWSRKASFMRRHLHSEVSGSKPYGDMEKHYRQEK